MIMGKGVILAARNRNYGVQHGTMETSAISLIVRLNCKYVNVAM